VAAHIVLTRGTDLDLDTVHAGVTVDDQRTDVVTDVQHDELRVRPR
jgi:hypothetical protein